MKKIFLYNGLSNMMFELVVWMIYLQANGWTLAQIAALEGTFTIVQVLFEFPSGVIADKLGHKLTLILGELWCLLYLFAFFFPEQHALLYLAFVIFALGLSLISGTNISLLYETVPDNERNHYLKYAGVFNATGIFGVAIANGLGGWFASISWTLLFSVAIFTRACSFITALTLENKRFEVEDSTESAEVLKVSILKELLRFIKGNRSYLWLLVTMCLSISAITLSYQYGQLVVSDATGGTGIVSLVYGGISLMGALLSLVTYPIARRVGDNLLVLVALVMGCAMVLLLPAQSAFLAILGLITANILFETWNVVLENKVQDLAVDSIRATSFSVINLSASFFLTLDSFIISHLSPLLTIDWALAVLCGMSLLLASIAFIIYWSTPRKVAQIN